MTTWEQRLDWLREAEGPGDTEEERQAYRELLKELPKLLEAARRLLDQEQVKTLVCGAAEDVEELRKWVQK